MFVAPGIPDGRGVQHDTRRHSTRCRPFSCKLILQYGWSVIIAGALMWVPLCSRRNIKCKPVLSVKVETWIILVCTISRLYKLQLITYFTRNISRATCPNKHFGETPYPLRNHLISQARFSILWSYLNKQFYGVIDLTFKVDFTWSIV